MLTNKHQCFPVESRQFNHLLVGNHVQLVKNCREKRTSFSESSSVGGDEPAVGAEKLTRAVLGQVLVFALLLLPKWAAGLAAGSGLAFARHPPATQMEISGNT